MSGRTTVKRKAAPPLPKRGYQNENMGGPCILKSGAPAPACTDNFQVAPFKFDGKEWQSCEQSYQVSVLRFVCRCRPAFGAASSSLHRRARASTLPTLRPSAASRSNRCVLAADFEEKNISFDEQGQTDSKHGTPLPPLGLGLLQRNNSFTRHGVLV